MAIKWYRPDLNVPTDGQLCWLRSTEYYGEPVKATYNASLQLFYSYTSGAKIPLYECGRWRPYDGSLVTASLGVFMAESYANLHSIPISSAFYLNTLLPLFTTIFSANYTDSLGTGYYYNTYKDYQSCDFLYVLIGNISGSSDYTWYDMSHASGMCFLNFNTNERFINTVPWSKIRSGSNIIVLTSISSFKYVWVFTSTALIIPNASQYLPSLKLTRNTIDSGYGNVSVFNALNSVIKDIWFITSNATNVTYRYISGCEVLDLSGINTTSFRGFYIQYTSFKSILLPPVFYASASATMAVLYFNNNQLPSAEIDRLFSDMRTKLTAMKASSGIHSNLYISVASNPGSLTGGTSNVDYLAIVALYTGTGFTVTIYL